MHPSISLETLKLRRMNLLQDSSCYQVSAKLQQFQTFRCNRTWCGRGTCRNKIGRTIHWKSRLGNTPFFFLFLKTVCHRNAADQAETFGAAKRAEMANIEPIRKIVPFITREITFGQDVCELVFGVNVTDWDFGVRIDPVKQPIQNNSVGP